jgi:hypothetical protein
VPPRSAPARRCAWRLHLTFRLLLSASALQASRRQVRLIRSCANVRRSAQRGCYEWLGKTLNVVTDGAFADAGCSGLRYSAPRESLRTRRACLQGSARSVRLT